MQPNPTLDELLSTATRAAKEAGKLLAERFGEVRELRHKGAIDLVTDADTAAEAAVLQVIRAAYPSHAVLAEESGAQDRASRYRWIIDPLDGTTNYAHAVPQFAVTLACEVDGEVAVGVIFDPMRDELYTATRGGGARCNGEAIAVSSCAEVSQALLSTGFPYWIQDEFEGAMALFSTFLRRAQGIRRFGSAALDLAWLAAGRYDGFFELGLKPWDIAAGALIVEEAGGRVTNLDGTPLRLDAGQILAGPAYLHSELLSIASAVKLELPPG